MDALLIHSQAALAAQNAVDAAIAQYGKDNSAFLYCGFAWVTIHPARGPFVNAMKLNKIGMAGYPKGWRISSNNMFRVDPSLGQSMELKEIGARAYANVLSANGIGCAVGSRAD